MRLNGLAIFKQQQSNEVKSLVYELLNDSDLRVKIEAAWAILLFNGEYVFEEIVVNLQHEDNEMVIGAALALGKLADNRAVKPLLFAFANTDNPKVGAALAWAIGQCRDVAALPLLNAAIENDFVAANACEALGAIGDLSSLNILLAALSFNNEDVRSYAARAISRLNFDADIKAKNRAITELQIFLQDQSRKVRLCAAVSLHRLGHL